MKRITIKIEDKDVRKGNPFWQFSRFKRVHKSKKTYNRKKKQFFGKINLKVKLQVDIILEHLT